MSSDFDRQLWLVLEDGDLITTDGYLSFSRSRDDVLYWKRDLLMRSGMWRGSNYKALLLGRHDPTKSTLIVGHSDRGTGPLLQSFARALGYGRLWGTNLRESAPFAAPLPLGLTNDCDDSPLHRILGDARHLHQAFMATERPNEESGTVMACFSIHTSPRHRSPLAKLIQDNEVFRWYEPDLTATGRIRFLAQLRAHDFVLCPRGNGVDTHRIWETLYMGGIPIVRRDESWPSLLINLPVVFVDNWSEVLDPEFRSREWHRINSGSWSAASLRQSTWNARISNSALCSG
jgi:hypothetical protein